MKQKDGSLLVAAVLYIIAQAFMSKRLSALRETELIFCKGTGEHAFEQDRLT